MISVIIPAKNTEETLERCLVPLLSQKGVDDPYEGILVDDGSKELTAEIAERFDVEVIRLEGERPAAARNAGAEFPKGEILVFTDADCEPAENWLLEMVNLSKIKM